MEYNKRINHELVELPKGEINRILRRGKLQIEFARAFAGLYPDRLESWTQLIDAASNLLDNVDARGEIAALSEALAQVEGMLHEIGELAKSYKLHCVGHGHIDMNWMWSWSETVATTHDTFASILHLMKKYPDLTYSQGQASVYALMERYHPDMFAEIRQRVAEGRWEVSAAHWVEGDKNISSAESLCRHLQYTRDYFQERFGLSPVDQPVDWEPDTFGHANTLPAILSQGAVKYYYSCRTGGGYDHVRIGDNRPALFYWEAPNGARVLVNREITWYGSYYYITENIALPLVDFVRETGLHSWLNIFGMGNHGGGPTQFEIGHIQELKTWPIYPTIEFSTAKRYFESIQGEIESTAKQIPVIAHELNFEFTGCYTSQSLIKQANRFGENYLLEAEAMAIIASRIFGAAYPSEVLREAWLKVLFSQFHDILPGSGVRQTREYAGAEFQEVGAITGAIKRNTIKSITGRINTAVLLPSTWAGELERSCALEPGFGASFEAGAGLGAATSGISSSGSYGDRFRPFVVFNPCTWVRSENVVATIYDAKFDPNNVVVLSDDGVLQRVLNLGEGVGTAWGHARNVYGFRAQDIPALGYRTFLICDATSISNEDRKHIALQDIRTLVSDRVETPTMRMQLSRVHGGVMELVDKRNGAQILPKCYVTPLGSFEFINEKPWMMTSWILGTEDRAPLPLNAGTIEWTGRAHILDHSSQLGSATAGLVASQRLNVPGTGSAVSLRMSISEHEPRLDFTAEIDWREIGSDARGVPGLIVSIPLGLTNISALYETPFGSVGRDLTNGEEVPSLRYAYVEGMARNSDGNEVFSGITLLQDCKYGHSIIGNDVDGYALRLRIIRSSFEPDHAPEVAITTVRYAIVLHDAPVDPAALARLGAEMNHPFMVIPAGVHEGDLPTSRGFARVETPEVMLTAIKKAEHSDGVVIRLAELTGKSVKARVMLDRQFAEGLTSATPVDLLERPIGDPIPFRDGHVTAPVNAYSFITLLLS